MPNYLYMNYNNVRGITNESNIVTNIEFTSYKILCFTETWLTRQFANHMYFALTFNVYIQDRIIQSNRRAGGVAMLIHKSINNRRNELPYNDSCEHAPVECVLKPTGLIIYLVYMKKFDSGTTEKYLKCIIMLKTNNSHGRF